MRRLFQAVFFLCTIFFLSACNTYTYVDGKKPSINSFPTVAIIGYSGDIKEFDEVGVLTTDGTINIVSIDGISRYFLRKYETQPRISDQTGRYQVHLMPGKHTVELSLYISELRKTTTGTVGTRIIEIKKGEVIHLSPIYPTRKSWDIKFSNGIAGLPEMKKDFQRLLIENGQ